MLKEQHPDLADLEIREVVGGWDNQMWRLGEELAVRVPRTERAPDLLRLEYRWLPELAGRLPLPTPVPLRLGEPSERFPKPWVVAAWVPGEPADRAEISRGAHGAEVLAGFLRALHVAAPIGAPVNSERGVSTGANFDTLLGAEFVAESGIAAGIREVWEDALAATDWDGPPVWLHGDLHPANVVVRDGTLAGVVDFGELGAGDPATDVAAAWIVLPAGAAGRFFEVYEVDAATVRRARGWAIRCACVLIAIGKAGERGLRGGKPTWLPAGRRALENLLA